MTIVTRGMWDVNLFDDLINVTNSDCLNLPISQEEILNSVSNLRGNRATGNDGICIEM